MQNKNFNFALLGAAGYIAPRHMQAIKATGNTLTAAMDCSDSVGIIDAYFPDANFFTEFEHFDRHIDKHRRGNSTSRVDYISICSPNYLHDAHIRFGLRSDANVICEKPLVLNPWDLDEIEELENLTNKRVNTILQLRIHPSLLALKRKIRSMKVNRKHDVVLSYITSRGKWYMSSWKANTLKSGGIATNIGIHFFDMLVWLFGSPLESIVHLSSPKTAAGFLELENANVRWFLSIDHSTLPVTTQQTNKTTFRSITIDGEEMEFSGGFSDLHVLSYQNILEGKGFTTSDARASIELAHRIRHATPNTSKGDLHPLLNQ